METSDILATKKAMRTRIIALRNEIPVEQREERSRLICEKAFAYGEARLKAEPRSARQNYPLVALFSSFGSEVSLGRFEELALGNGYRLCYPAMIRPAEGERAVMEFFEVPEELIRSKDADFLTHPARACTFEEPLSAGCTFVASKDIDFAIVPLVAFDGQGGRLGYGGGNYDAFLSEKREGVVACGVAFLEQKVDEVPREAHDLPIDDVVFG